eukprot:2729797-Pleurochrysis_carterae.AAC.1
MTRVVRLIIVRGTWRHDRVGIGRHGRVGTGVEPLERCGRRQRAGKRSCYGYWDRCGSLGRSEAMAFAMR